MGRHTILNGDDGSPYQTRYWLGRARLHVMYRGDLDPDAHDHPWSFWTFPLHSYVEEVWHPDGYGGYRKRWEVVRAWRLHYRPATYLHRIIGRWSGGYTAGFQHFVWDDQFIAHPKGPMTFVPGVKEGTIVTLVWRGRKERAWGFMKNRAGRWCWQAWRDYVNGGRNAACSDD